MGDFLSHGASEDRFRITCADGEEVFIPSERFVALMILTRETGIGPGTVWRMISGACGTRPPRRRRSDDA